MPPNRFLQATPRPRRRLRSRILAAVAVAATAFSVAATANTASAQVNAAQVNALASAGCGQSPGMNSGNHTIQVNGLNRSFILKVPDNYDPNYQHKLIFGLHWWGGTADQVAGGGSDGAVYAHYGLEQQAGGTAIFVAPQGIDNAWPDSGGRDVAFVDAMIQRIESALCVDESQRFSLGFSYGGAMSYALACARPDQFRAVAAIAVPGPVSGCSGGSQPVAYMGIQGVTDSMPQARGMRDRFVSNNGCTPQNPPEPASGSGQHFTTTYSGCQDGYPVVWAAFDGGHQQGPVDGCTGCESGAQSWVKGEIWDFFSQFGDSPPPQTDAGALTGQASGKCVDVPNQSTTDGTQVQVWDCWSGANQQWTHTASGELSVYSGGSRKCLDASEGGTSDGAAVIIWSCHGGENQRWNLNGDGSITSAASGLCLDVSGASTANGALVQLWSCHGGGNQKWTLN
ncbi:RICIN domain-containing protein [Myceligenerans halotolerans]